jgi:hypothetical protein
MVSTLVRINSPNKELAQANQCLQRERVRVRCSMLKIEDKHIPCESLGVIDIKALVHEFFTAICIEA